MQRRDFHHAATGFAGALLLGAWSQAQALNLSQLTNAEASSGVKAALTQGAEAAVGLLGKPDGCRLPGGTRSNRRSIDAGLWRGK